MARILNSVDPSLVRNLYFRGFSIICQDTRHQNASLLNANGNFRIEIFEPVKATELGQDASPSNQTRSVSSLSHTVMSEDMLHWTKSTLNPDSNKSKIMEKLTCGESGTSEGIATDMCATSLANFHDSLNMFDPTFSSSTLCDHYDTIQVKKKHKNKSTFSSQVREMDMQYKQLIQANSKDNPAECRQKIYSLLKTYEKCLEEMFYECLMYNLQKYFKDAPTLAPNLVSGPSYPQRAWSDQSLSNPTQSRQFLDFCNMDKVTAKENVCKSDVNSNGASENLEAKDNFHDTDVNPSGNGGDVDKGDKPSREQLELVKNYFVDKLPNVLEERLEHEAYDPQVILVNQWPRTPCVRQGLTWYTLELMKLKMWTRLMFNSVSVHVISCSVNEVQGYVKIRWRITGEPKVKFYKKWRAKAKDLPKHERETKWIDGISMLYVNKDGLVNKHVIEPFDRVENPGIKTKLGNQIASTMFVSKTLFEWP